MEEPSGLQSTGSQRVKHGLAIKQLVGQCYTANKYCSDVGPSSGVQQQKNLPAKAGDIGDMGLMPGSGRSSGGGNGSPLQYSFLENPMDRGAWWATVRRVVKSRLSVRLTPRLQRYAMLLFIPGNIPCSEVTLRLTLSWPPQLSLVSVCRV